MHTVQTKVFFVLIALATIENVKVVHIFIVGRYAAGKVFSM